MTDTEAFWRAYVATRALVGSPPPPTEVPEGARALAAQLAPGSASRADRAALLARELTRVGRALEARRLR
jgi:hypothetical protein